jgi:hypothetical protein
MLLSGDSNIPLGLTSSAMENLQAPSLDGRFTAEDFIRSDGVTSSSTSTDSTLGLGFIGAYRRWYVVSAPDIPNSSVLTPAD